MCRSYDETRSGDLPGVKAWSERLFDFIARRMIQDGVDEDDVAADTLRIDQAVNKLWIDPYEDDEEVPSDEAIAHNRAFACAGSCKRIKL